MRGNPGGKKGWGHLTLHHFIRLFAIVLMAFFLCTALIPSTQVYAVSGDEIAADGEYWGTITATKRKDEDTYYATLYVGVEDGIISYVSIDAYEKADKFYEYAYPQAQAYVGQPASVASITDAVASASSSDGSSKYTMDVAGAMRDALYAADARVIEEPTDDDIDEPVEDDRPDNLAAEGVYTGKYEMDQDHWLTVDVTVDGEGKISDVTLKEAGGNWDNLLNEVKGNYIGSWAESSQVDAVTTATEKGYRSAIGEAIKNALNGTGPNPDDSGNTDEPDVPGENEDEPEPEIREDVVYESGTVETVSGKTFTGIVTVKAGAEITFENCRFPYGIELEDSSAIAIVKNSYFGTEKFYIPVSDNSLGEVDEKIEVTKDNGLAVSFPSAAFNKDDTSTTTSSVYQESSLSGLPDWAGSESFEQTVDTETYHGHYLTGKVPEVKEDTKQSFGTYLRYQGDDEDSKLEMTIPLVFTVKDVKEEETTSHNGETIIDPGTGGVERDKDDSFDLSKGVNVTNVLPGNTFTLTLEANATGTTTTETQTGAANILLVLDNTTSMTAAYGSTDRLSAMKTAAASFVSGLPVSEGSQIAMMSFVVGDRQSPTTTDVAWTPLNEEAKGTVTGAINGLSAPDQQYGYETSYVTPLNAATTYVDYTGNDNPTYVVFFTDGDDINSQADLETAAAALKAKTKGVFSIGIVQARYFYDDEAVFRAKAQAIASQGDYYYEPATAADLTAAFNQSLQVIQKDISTSNTTLDASAVFKDVVNTDKFDVSEATAAVTVYDYDNGTWQPLGGASASAPAGGSGTLDSWTNKHEADGTLTVSMQADGTVTITGFSYKDHYLPTNDQEAEGVNAQRLHLEISGIKLKDGAQQVLDQTDVPTNIADQSGMFKDPDASNAVKNFPLPKVNIPGKGGASQTTENVQRITVDKKWDGKAGDKVEVQLLEDGKVKDTQNLSAENNWTYTWEELDGGKTYAVAEKAAWKADKDVSADYTTEISEPKVKTDTKTEQGWGKKNFLTADTIVDGGIYVFSYEYYSSTYLLGVSTNRNPSPAGVGAAVENGKVTEFPENAQWIATKSGDGYTLRNVYSNTYLVMNAYGSLSMGNEGSVFDLDDGDGSIYSGNYNIRCTSYPSTNSNYFTEFTAYEFTDKTVNIQSAAYTITNKEKKETPVINTGIMPADQKPILYLGICIAAFAVLLAAAYVIRKKVKTHENNK